MRSNFVKIDEVYNNRRVAKEIEPKQYGKRKDLTRRWLVECCNCGTQITMLNNDIRRSGCKVCHDLPKGETGFNRLYASYLFSAKERGIDFSLTKEVFKSLTQLPCHYCGIPPSAVQFANRRSSAFWTDFIYSGVDRIDNSKGYLIDNCVPCCNFCNHAKRDYSYQEFMMHISRIVSFRNQNAL